MKEVKSISIYLNGDLLHCDISKSTTCDDVITRVIKNMSVQTDSECFAIFESILGVRKMLPGQTKLLKYVRSWGASKQDFAFEMREVDKVTSKMASLSRAKVRLQRLRSMVMKHEIKLNKKSETYLNDNLISSTVEKDKKLYDKNITVIGKTAECGLPIVLGKKELLRRFLTDSIEQNSPYDKMSNEVFLSTRTRGVGSESDSLSELDPPERTGGDGEEGTSYSQLPEGECNMNTAFMINDTLVDSMSCNVKDELNECVLYDQDETSLADTASALEDDSDYNSLDGLERNIESAESSTENTYIKMDDIRKMFDNGDLNSKLNEDDLLESFMHTFMNDDGSDEGMSSVESDFD